MKDKQRFELACYVKTSQAKQHGKPEMEWAMLRATQGHSRDNIRIERLGWPVSTAIIDIAKVQPYHATSRNIARQILAQGLLLGVATNDRGQKQHLHFRAFAYGDPNNRWEEKTPDHTCDAFIIPDWRKLLQNFDHGSEHPKVILDSSGCVLMKGDIPVSCILRVQIYDERGLIYPAYENMLRHYTMDQSKRNYDYRANECVEERKEWQKTDKGKGCKKGQKPNRQKTIFKLRWRHPTVKCERCNKRSPTGALFCFNCSAFPYKEQFQTEQRQR